MRVSEHGSSPLTRGAPNLTREEIAHERLIPAHAGSTAAGNSTNSETRAHPRSRGEHHSVSPSSRRVRGSSPLTRGARGHTGLRRGHSGLIPAHAGSTVGCSPTGRTTRAHPRSRGEHLPVRCCSAGRAGSSPLTRGALPTCRWTRRWCRLIPAHAGSTRIRKCLVSLRGAHPRSRGEHRWRAFG